jgi:hypothetical protein
MNGRGRVAISTNGRRCTAAMASIALAFALAGPARANTGYELDSTSPTVSLGSKDISHGLAVDQSNRRLYVAVLSTDGPSLAPGKISRFASDRSPAGTFGAGSETYYSGIAVNPVTQAFYGVETVIESPFGNRGAARLNPFSSLGVPETPFALSKTGILPQIATDSSGDIYYPNALTDTVQVFNGSGALQETIACGGCPGGAFGTPASVALNSEDDLYVVDLEPDRVVKFSLSGGSYAFDSILQSGRGAGAVGVDPSTDDVFVGNLVNGRNYHVTAYSSAGVQFDDFGAGLFTDPIQYGAVLAVQIAADATSHELYVGDLGKVYVFDRVTIIPPTVVTDPASGIGQQVAKLNATVNAKGHAVLACDFEYVDDAEFLAEGFADPTTVACSKKPDGTANVAVSASLSGLSPSTKYHFRAVATSNAGTTTGATQTFTTLPNVPPTVTTDPPTSVTETGATLIGRVNPHGGTVSDCHFEYGATSSYGSSVPCPSQIGPVISEVTQKVAIEGLSSGTGYHYRLVVTTNAGSTPGDDVAFTTVSPPPPTPDPIPTAPAPSPVVTPPPVTPPTATSCKPGFVKVKSGGKVTCLKRCRKGFVRRKVGGKLKCVKQRPRRRDARR